MADDYRNFKSNPLERLGVKNDEFKEALNQIAFTKPATYFAIKKKYTEYLMSSVVQKLHGLIFYALTDGLTVDDKGGKTTRPILDADLTAVGGAGAISITGIDGVTNASFKPSLPGEIADKIAMDVVLTLKDAFQEDVIDKIFTTDQINRAFATKARQAEMELGEV